jgi:hypothetical protein
LVPVHVHFRQHVAATLRSCPIGRARHHCQKLSTLDDIKKFLEGRKTHLYKANRACSRCKIDGKEGECAFKLKPSSMMDYEGKCTKCKDWENANDCYAQCDATQPLVWDCIEKAEDAETCLACRQSGWVCFKTAIASGQRTKTDPWSFLCTACFGNTGPCFYRSKRKNLSNFLLSNLAALPVCDRTNGSYVIRESPKRYETKQAEGGSTMPPFYDTPGRGSSQSTGISTVFGSQEW